MKINIKEIRIKNIIIMGIETIIVITKTIIIEIKIIKIGITLVTKGDISMIIPNGIIMVINRGKMIIMTGIIMKTECVINAKIIGINIIKGLEDSYIIISIIKDNHTKDRVNIIGKKIFKGKNINILKISISMKSKKDKTREMTNIKISPLDKK